MIQMKRFRKKPVEIEAFQLSGENLEVAIQSGFVQCREPSVFEVYDHLHDTWVKCEAGDWIIRGIEGEIYPCKASVFEQTYEPVE